MKRRRRRTTTTTTTAGFNRDLGWIVGEFVGTNWVVTGKVYGAAKRVGFRLWPYTRDGGRRTEFQNNYAGTMPLPPSSTAEPAEGFAAFFHRQDRLPRDELELYLAEPCLTFTDPQRTFEFRALTWWTEPAQMKRFPHLSKLAWDLLTVPVTNAEIERIFSECASSLSDKRLGMTLHRSWERYARKGGRVEVSLPSLLQALLTNYR